MNTMQHTARLELAIFVARHAPDISSFHIANTLGKLVRIAAKLDRLAVRNCNGEGWSGPVLINGRWCPQWNDSDVERYYCEWDRLTDKAGELVRPLGLVINAQGDPRGCVLRVLDYKSGRQMPVL